MALKEGWKISESARENIVAELTYIADHLSMIDVTAMARRDVAHARARILDIANQIATITTTETEEGDGRQTLSKGFGSSPKGGRKSIPRGIGRGSAIPKGPRIPPPGYAPPGGYNYGPSGEPVANPAPRVIESVLYPEINWEPQLSWVEPESESGEDD